MKTFLNNQYDKLNNCILVFPVNIEKTKDTKNVDINLNRAINQYNSLVNVLIENDVKPYFLNSNGNPSQLFAKDIGFIIKDLLFISNMKNPKRQSEIEGLKEFAKINNIKHYIMQSTCEGGDIFVHNNNIFIGQADRTNEDAFIEIENVLKNNFANYECIKVFFDPSKIHLDCAFNIIDKNSCIISKDVFNKDVVLKHFTNVIEIDSNELAFLAPNIVVLGNKILCSSENFTKILQSYGFNTIYIQFDEIIKDRGGLGCCVLSLFRSNQV